MRVIVLLGGDSTERDVSHVSGRAVAGALQRQGHEVLAVDTRGGKRIDIQSDMLIHQAPPENSLAVSTGALQVVDQLHKKKFGAVDVVFIALHGTGGEDGTIQGMLNAIDMPYTGSGVMASSVAMDKEMSKRVFRDAGVPTPDGVTVVSDQPMEEIHRLVRSSCAYPVVVKPNSQGSSVGVHIVERSTGLADAIRSTAEFDERILVETFIPGREFTVSILGEQALPVVEIVAEKGFYDYRSKYTPGNIAYHVPAELGGVVAASMQQAAERAFMALHCRDFARVDFRMSPSGELYCLEVNTIPGMTASSLVPKAASAAGIEFDDLVERIVLMTMARAGVGTTK